MVSLPSCAPLTETRMKNPASRLMTLTAMVALPTLPAGGTAPALSAQQSRAPALTCDSLSSTGELAAESRYTTPAEALEVVAFWKEAGPAMWFAKDAAFDQRFRERFMPLYEKAARNDLRHWARTPDGALGLLILLDQFPRNAFRGTPRMYATDALARATADAALTSGFDCVLPKELSLFMYLPFGHSENLVDQERSVNLAQRLGQPSIAHAEMHRDIIRRFGRFPHRNPILGRAMRPEEQAYLDSGGFQG